MYRLLNTERCLGNAQAAYNSTECQTDCFLMVLVSSKLKIPKGISVGDELHASLISMTKLCGIVGEIIPVRICT
jgi:hypothetical protein